MEEKPIYTIFVNSTDNYSDCWLPFFFLLKANWTSIDKSIFLNSEIKTFSYPGLKIINAPPKSGLFVSKPSWSELTRHGLDRVQTEIILYLQEDYFLHGPVNWVLIDEFANYMLNHPISTISLVEFSNHGPFNQTDHTLLWEVGRRANYRISLQAALWRKVDFIKYLRKHENAWQFEIYGSARARRYHDNFYCVNRDYIRDHGSIFPYKPTGIIKGKWNREVVETLFSRMGLQVDFYERGFWDPDVHVTLPKITFRKIRNYIKSFL